MARNYVQDGDSLSLTAPYARNAGEGALIGTIFAIALNDVANAVAGQFATGGVWDIFAQSTATGAQGARAYWDDTNKRVDTVSTVGQFIGRLTEAKTSGQTTARVLLNEAGPEGKTGMQAAVADIATADATDLASAEALANATKAKVNTLLAELRAAGIIAP